jgi:hypothetical protein
MSSSIFEDTAATFAPQHRTPIFSSFVGRGSPFSNTTLLSSLARSPGITIAFRTHNSPKRKCDRICNQGLVCRDGCVEKELDFTSITDVASPVSPITLP